MSEIIDLNKNGISASVSTTGGLVTRLNFGGHDLIVPSGNDNLKRSGIPRLLPWIGPRQGLPQHGFGRITELEIVEQSPVSLTLREGQWPSGFPGVWDIHTRYEIRKQCFLISICIENLESVSRSLAVGLHPYFNPENLKPRIDRQVLDPQELGVVKRRTSANELVLDYGSFGYNLSFVPKPMFIADWRENDLHRCIEPWWGNDDGTLLTFRGKERQEFKMDIKKLGKVK